MRLTWSILALTVCLTAAEHRGIVRFNNLPIPGAAVTAVRGDLKAAAVTDESGTYTFPELADGDWTVSVEMTGFGRDQKTLAVAAGAPPAEWQLKMLDAVQLDAAAAVTRQTPPPAAASPPEDTNGQAPPAPKPEAFSGISPEELLKRAADGLLINGSVNNGASSPFSLANAFGNNRRGQRSLYDGSLGMILGNSVFDARPYSLTGQDFARPDYNRVQGVLAFGGPLKIPRLLPRNGPNLTVNYQWSRTRDVTTQTGRVPTADERKGLLSGLTIPASAISTQAQALLALYPLPNFADNARYNFQVPVTTVTHEDNLQTRFNQTVTRRNYLSGLFAYASTRSDNPNLFGFLDKNSFSGVNSGVNWLHMYNQRLYTMSGVQFSRATTRITPFFSNRINISGEAGIAGNNQDPVNWGPPSLSFASGIVSLGDAQASLTRNQTTGVSADNGWNRGTHNVTFGGLFRRQQFNLLSQQDPRGTFAFTGAATGSDFGGFLRGIPDTASIAFGNADKYLRGSWLAAYVTDDWRVRPGLTFTTGVRWEYTSPLEEKYGRLVNLVTAPGFTAATPLTGTQRTLLRPDRNNIAPRIGFAWRPFGASTIFRGGYGVYHDTSVYLPIAAQMAQQYPLSTSLRIDNSAGSLNLANAFRAGGDAARTTFAVDPAFAIGYAQNWTLSAQRDLPASLVMIATYLGSKGTRAQQEFLPNTYPAGASIPCSACPSGYTYLASNGNSIRHAAQIELRRRLRAGFTSTVQYTFAKSLDNAALGGIRNQAAAVIAQDWLNLSAERALSNTDQRHLLSVTSQYTTGMGLRGGTLAGGWRGAALKDWTLASQLTAGSGFPLTPVYFTAVRGTGVTGSIRPDYTGAPLYDAPSGRSLNPAAYAAPQPGRWGNAGRNSITGPSQLTLNGSLSRTFRVSDRSSLDFRLDAINALNHPVFPSWNTQVTSAQFGLPNNANPMRSMQTTVRFRF